MTIMIKVDRGDLKRVSNRIKNVGRLPKYSLDAGYEWLNEAKKSIGRQLMIEKAENRSRAPRTTMKASILKAQRMRSGKMVWFKLPLKATALELGKPRIVNMRGNANARKWVEKYYNRKAIRRVRRGSLKSKPYIKGKLKGQLHIVPHPYVAKGLRNVRHRLKPLLNKALKKTVKGG